jgi:SAM-dependent methyltransferase
MSIERSSVTVAVAHPDAYDVLGETYDLWSVSVTEDIAFYVDLALACDGPVLEIGVGSGRIAIPIALTGTTVVGIDTSSTMLERAAAKAEPHHLDLHLIEADMRAIPDLGRFPLVIVPFRAFLHLGDDHERLAVLTRLHQLLTPGGTLAFDVFHPHPLDIEETHDRPLEREPGIFERARWDADEQSLELTVRQGEKEAVMDLHWATASAWADLLAEAGFNDVERYGWFDRRQPEEDDTDSVWVAR